MSEKNGGNITNTKQFTSGLNIKANVGCKFNVNYAPAGDDRITVRVTGTKRRVDAITVEERGGDIVARVKNAASRRTSGMAQITVTRTG